MTPCLASAHTGWWHKPDYIINELSINSVIARPWHDEVLSLETSSSYTMQGYAYTGEAHAAGFRVEHRRLFIRMTITTAVWWCS